MEFASPTPPRNDSPAPPFMCVPIVIDSTAPNAAAAIDRVNELAATFHLPVQTSLPASGKPYLHLTQTRLELAIVDDPLRPIFTDFIGGRMGFRRKRLSATNELLRRAIGRPTRAAAADLTIWDLTAGLGRDTCILAALGCQVTAWERVPALAALLADGCRRAEIDADYARQMKTKIQLRYADAKLALASLAPENTPSILYLDPMFPARRKSAAVKKEMKICQIIAGADADAGELLTAARATCCPRIIVKRPRYAPALAEKPTREIFGQSIRYDIYISES